VVKNCDFCGVVIEKPRPKQRFCSCKCTHGRRAQDGWVVGNCIRCGTEFRKHKNRGGKYCKKACLIADLVDAKKAQAKPPVEGDCQVCGQHFIGTRPDQKFCSVKCATKVTAPQMGKENREHFKDKPCATCGVMVSVARNVPDKKVHCEEHRSFYKEPKPRNCQQCGKHFMAIRPTNFWCSIKCASSVSAKQRAEETKDVPCVSCSDTVTVPRSTDHNRVMCLVCRRDSKRAGNARWATEQQEKKKAEMCAVLQAVIDAHGPDAPEVEQTIKTLTPRNKFHRPMLEAVVAKARALRDEAAQMVVKNAEREKRIAAFRMLIPNLVNSKCARPYDHYKVTAVAYDVQEETWMLTMEHVDVKNSARTMMLARYLLEAKVGRLLREDETITWVNGNKDECAIDNLRIVVNIEPLEYRGFWSAPKKKSA
jgi:hypothetical protein